MGQTGNSRAENTFTALMLIGCRDVKKTPIGQSDHEDTISMTELTQVYLDKFALAHFVVL